MNPLQKKLQKNEIFYKIETDLDKEKEHFYDIVEKAKEYIKMGDIFQVVLSEQLCLESNIDSLEFYKKRLKPNPSPYSVPLSDKIWRCGRIKP